GPILGMPIRHSGGHSHWSGKVRPGEIWLKAFGRSAIAGHEARQDKLESPCPTCSSAFFSIRRTLAVALNSSSFEGAAHRGSVLFRCERTYFRGVTLQPKINTLEGRLTKQCWLLFLQPAKDREHIGLAAA